MGGKFAIHHIAKHRDGTLGTQSFFDAFHVNQGLEPLGFEVRAKIPEIEIGIQLALPCLFCQQRRGGEYGNSLIAQVNAIAFAIGLQHQPALVECAARHAELLVLQVLDTRQRGGARHHDRTNGRGIGREHEIGTQPALTRHPQPVTDNQVSRPAAQGNLARFRAGKFNNVEFQVGRFIEPARLDDLQFPSQ